MSRIGSVGRRTIVLVAMGVALSPRLAIGQPSEESPIIRGFQDFRAYLERAAQVVQDLTVSIREARAQGRLSEDEEAAIARIGGNLEQVLGGQLRNTDFLMDYVIAARDASSTPTSLATRWREVGYRVSQTSNALARVVSAARNSPAFAAALPADVAWQFYSLAESRAGIMGRIIDLPMPTNDRELAALEDTVASWRTLITRSQALLELIVGRSTYVQPVH